MGMSRYHISPKTGEPGECKAVITCPFAAHEDHYSSPEEAREAYEKMQADLAVGIPIPTKAEKREAKFREELEPLVGVAAVRFARYQEEGKKGFIEDAVVSVYQLQKAVFPTEPGSIERQRAVAARNEGLRQLLAADIALHRGVAEKMEQEPDHDIEVAMVRNARHVMAAHEGLEGALGDSTGQREYARALRVQPEDVEYVIRRALKEYNEPRARQSSLSELADDRGFTAGAARQLRVQPEDVTRIMGLALGHSPRV